MLNLTFFSGAETDSHKRYVYQSVEGIWCSRLSPDIQQDLIEALVAGIPASPAAALLGIDRTSALLPYHKRRDIIFKKLATETPFFDGDAQVNEGILWAPKRENAVVGRRAKYLCLVS